jgi:hypothetical protein
MYITLDNDRWEDLGKRYFVIEWKRRTNSTAVDLVLEDECGNIIRRTEPLSYIIEERSND